MNIGIDIGCLLYTSRMHKANRCEILKAMGLEISPENYDEVIQTKQGQECCLLYTSLANEKFLFHILYLLFLLKLPFLFFVNCNFSPIHT